MFYNQSLNDDPGLTMWSVIRQGQILSPMRNFKCIKWEENTYSNYLNCQEVVFF